MDLRRHASLWTAAAFLATSAGAVARAAGPDEDAIVTSGCALARPGNVESTTESCVACHRIGSGSNHPFDVDYGVAVVTKRGSDLRPLDEVVRRGAFLVDGKVQCRTCHDPRSPWANHIALPPGAKPMPMVNPRDPRTYEDGPARTALIQDVQHPGVGGERKLVTAKPLCLVCHALD